METAVLKSSALETAVLETFSKEEYRELVEYLLILLAYKQAVKNVADYNAQHPVIGRMFANRDLACKIRLKLQADADGL